MPFHLFVMVTAGCYQAGMALFPVSRTFSPPENVVDVISWLASIFKKETKNT